MIPYGKPLNVLAIATLAAALLPAQGPASCGFHLDVRADGTSTHSAIADMPNAPGGGGFPYPPGAPGNPYTAWATPGAPLALTISGNALAYGPAPLGAGSCVTLFYSFGAAMVPMLTGAPFIPTCVPGTPTVVGILPIGGTIFDSCGFLGPPPPFGFFDGGSGRFVFTGAMPAFGGPVSFQAAGITPGGAIWLTNAVTIIPGVNPAEIAAPVVPCAAAIAPMASGQAVGIPAPPGFAFYGMPVGAVDMDVDGFVDFVPGAGPLVAGGCDPVGTYGDFGCAPATPTARPRVDVNHADYDFTIPIAPPFIPAMTYETRPPGPAWPEALILRWKNAPSVGTMPGTAGLLTAALAVELEGVGCAGFCTPPFLPRISVVRSWLPVTTPTSMDQVGIGPGTALQGFGGPPPLGSTCGFGATGLAFMTTFAPPFGLPFFGPPAGAIHMDSAAPAFTTSLEVRNSAIVFTPMGLPFPDAYSVVVY
jgi:hypothetical protein